MKKYFNLFSGRSLKFSSIGSLLISLTGTGLTFLVSIVLARYLNVEDYGFYIYTYSLVLLFSVMLTLGFPVLLMRIIPEYELSQRFDLLKGLLIRINQYIIISFILISLILLIIIYSFKEHIHNFQILTYLWALCLLFTNSFNTIKASTLQGFRFSFYALIPDLIIKNILLFLGTIIYFLINNEISSYEAMAIHFSASLVSLIVGNQILNFKIKAQIKDITPVFETKEWFAESFVLSLTVGANKLKTKIPILILSFFIGKSAVAFYDVAQKGAKFMSFSLNALNLAFAPHVSRAFQQGDNKYLQSVIKKTSRLIFLFGLPVFLTYLFVGEFILEKIYGFEYKDSYIYLMIICVSQLFNLGSGSVGLILNMTSNHKLVFKANLYNLILNFFLTLILVYYFGILGASIAYAFSLITLNIVLVIIAKRKLDLNTTIF